MVYDWIYRINKQHVHHLNFHSTGLASLVSAHGLSSRIRFRVGSAVGNPSFFLPGAAGGNSMIFNYLQWKPVLYGFTCCDMV